MPPLSLKPDTSFFRKIATGAVGTRAIVMDLNSRGHDFRELERGALDTKLWKEVKRKRVRIPDLVCVRCGQRVESKAKTKSILSLSHSRSQAERSWDYGMIPSDWFAFPVIQALKPEETWSLGTLEADRSYWHERSWLHWRPRKTINYFTVAEFRTVPKAKETAPKGAEEGSEITWVWDARFATQPGAVLSITSGQDDHKIKVAFNGGGGYTWTAPSGWGLNVQVGDTVDENTVLASPLAPLDATALTCRANLDAKMIGDMLGSREKTARFTGVKLARLRQDATHQRAVSELAADEAEDIYVRLEAASYLVATCSEPASSRFRPYLESQDDQLRLEAVIALGETQTEEAVEILCAILDATENPYFLRSAAAWALSQAASQKALARLVAAFGDLDEKIKEEALIGIVSSSSLPSKTSLLFEELQKQSDSVAAGCAEALRQLSMQQALPAPLLKSLVERLAEGKDGPFSVWLAGSVAKKQVGELVAQLQASRPETHYAITVLWAFMESWIAKRWELDPRGHLSEPPV